MKRRHFIRNSSVIGSGIALSGPAALAGSPLLPSSSANASAALANTPVAGMLTSPEEPWFDKSLRSAQLAFVENDPGHFDPDFWLDYFKRIHADGALLSAGGVAAFYPTNVP